MINTTTNGFQNSTSIGAISTSSFINTTTDGFHNFISVTAVRTSELVNITSSKTSKISIKTTTKSSGFLNSTSTIFGQMTLTMSRSYSYPTANDSSLQISNDKQMKNISTGSSNVLQSRGNVVSKATSTLDIRSTSHVKPLDLNIITSFRHGGLPKIRSIIFKEQDKSLELEMTSGDNSEKVKRANSVTIFEEEDSTINELDNDNLIKIPRFSKRMTEGGSSFDRLVDTLTLKLKNKEDRRESFRESAEEFTELMNCVTSATKLETESRTSSRFQSRYIKNSSTLHKVRSSILFHRGIRMRNLEPANNIYAVSGSNIVNGKHVKTLSDSEEVIFEGLSQRMKLNICGFILFMTFLIIA
ncbi:hypothetical protein C6P45_003556 [Maudiozyma exigua]|uniref:Uncharacterized protein n=1 Tax=Maudiozyma exigua TaxID=34358 RepID=A0A9P6VTW3_MAUEX|nr:hypothetical protein C6P45_003556 [Kazachstania exigua]